MPNLEEAWRIHNDGFCEVCAYRHLGFPDCKDMLFADLAFYETDAIDRVYPQSERKAFAAETYSDPWFTS